MKALLAIIIITFFSVGAFAQAGELDSTFGSGGIVLTPCPCFGAWFGGPIALQSDGKIVVAGSADCAGPINYGWGIARYNSDGSLDNSFNGSGTLIGSIYGGLYSMSVLENGKIAVEYWDNLYNYLSLFNSDGSPGAGYLIPNQFLFSPGMASQADGTTLIAGCVLIGAYQQFSIAKFSATGGLDSTFGVNGILTTQIDSASFARSISIQADGKIIAAGSCGPPSDSYDWNFVLVRYFPNGIIDSSFGTNGIVITDIQSSNDQLNTISISADLELLATGSFFTTASNGVAVLKYTMDGQLDNSFFTQGKLIIPFDTNFFSYPSIAFQSDWKVVAGGTMGAYQNTMYGLIRYNIDGTLDSGFGSNGVVVTTPSPYGLNHGASVAIQSDGKILESGTAYDEFGLVRYLSGLELGILNFSSPQSSPLIYPNPIQQNETLEYTLTKDETLTIALYDGGGKLVQSFITNENRTAGEHSEQLMMNKNLSAGNYVLTLSNSSNNVSVKMMKQ